MSAVNGSDHKNDRATFRMYGRVADKLELTIAERCAVLGLDRLTFDRWQANPTDIELSDNHIQRSSELLAVYDGLLKIFGNREVAISWLRCDNPEFGGKPPLAALFTAETMQFQSVFNHIESILIMCEWPEPSEN